MRRSILLGVAVLLAAGSAPAAAGLRASDERGFVSHHEIEVAASPAEVWETMLRPASWWSDEHTYSGSAANLSIAPVAGGCFCEVVPGTAGNPGGEIEHMRVIYVAPPSTLRLAGGLGPLQSEAVIGVLTITLEPLDEGTRMKWEYIVGGYTRVPAIELAQAVDRVVGEQASRLAARFYPR